MSTARVDRLARLRALQRFVRIADSRLAIGDRALLRAAAVRVAPFAGACCLAWVAVLVDSSVTWWEYWSSLTLGLIAGGVAVIAIVDRRYPWLAVVPSALLLLTAVALVRDSAGGLASGMGALAILPVFQIALYSRSKRDLSVVLAAVALFFVIPIWIVGPPAYPRSQYRTVILAVAADAVVGLVTQRLVARIRGQVGESQARQRMLEQVAATVHGLFDSPDPRQEVCEAALGISSAAAALLFEPLANTDQLRCTATAGIHADVDQAPVQPRSLAYVAMRTAQPVLVTENIEAHVGLLDAWIASGRPSSLLYQPLLRGGRPLGVLVIGWPTHVRIEGPRATVIALLAHEVAAVISRADALHHLNDEALTDPLTGLSNRRAWDQHLRQLSITGQLVAIAMLDLDHFKQFNDSHGHSAGDRLLQQTAAAWRNQLRTGDVLARIGGEEFGLLLPDCDPDTANEVVDRLRAHVTDHRTCSAGIAIKQHHETIQAAVERADAALYQAKARGRDQSLLAGNDRVSTHAAGVPTRPV